MSIGAPDRIKYNHSGIEFINILRKNILKSIFPIFPHKLPEIIKIYLMLIWVKQFLISESLILRTGFLVMLCEN